MSRGWLSLGEGQDRKGHEGELLRFCNALVFDLIAEYLVYLVSEKK